MVPDDIQGNWGDPAIAVAKPGAGGANLRQAIGHAVDAAVHADSCADIGIIIGLWIAADKVGQQVTEQRAVCQRGQVKMGEKIHPLSIREHAAQSQCHRRCAGGMILSALGAAYSVAFACGKAPNLPPGGICGCSLSSAALD
ncbi:hypothetical protein KB20921_09620 [Edwardsiella ictaluri]|nr:hypothetical protein KH20906_09280 [Edwardsiella ictaluri]BEI01701.1 hypothetical protein KB20921_09620 [Edwardsiella ictaluri]BEI05170.1 hypothetical protein KH201010_09560 [Edwardsiella ictaluri]BEI08627.1 hypothetical protein STU22726_09580 [Edwardsiella ictaluri]BEI12109.1 hypothetical protein STU22816_09620 [Edwardsiella ictaluri]